MVVRCQTNGVISPEEAFDQSLDDLHTEFDQLRKAFQAEVDKLKPSGNFLGTPYHY